jgi:ABC-type branched-subunit amino acid transport system ATPase component
MTDPELIIFDEPSLGLSPLFVQEVFRIIRRLKKSARTILLVEQNFRQTLDVADFGYVLARAARPEGPSISLVVVLSVCEDGQKVLLAVKTMGGETAEA